MKPSVCGYFTLLLSCEVLTGSLARPRFPFCASSSGDAIFFIVGPALVLRGHERIELSNCEIASIAQASTDHR